MSQLMAGAAKVKMTPSGDAWPAMGMLPDQEYTRVHDDIYVRVLVLDNGKKKAVIFSMELQRPFCTEEIRKYLKDTYDIEPNYVFFSGTHTHEGPNLAGIPRTYGGNETSGEWGVRYRKQVYEHSKEAADQALAHMRPAQIGYGEGKSYINVCRDRKFENGVWGQGANFAGPSDKTLAALKVVDNEGHLIAAVLNYACHGVACFLKTDEDGNLMLSGDVPGMVSAYVEERYSSDSSVCLWTQGCSGNQNPIFTAKFLGFGHDGVDQDMYDPGVASWDLCRSLAEDQGSDAAQIIESIQANEKELEIGTAKCTREAPGREVSFYSDDFEEILAMQSGAIPFEGYEVDAEPEKFVFQLLTLNDTAFFFINSEVVSEIGMRLKEISPLKHTVIVTISEEESTGYIPDKLGYDRHTFEYFGSRVKDGKGEEYITDAMLELFANRERV